MEGSGEKADVDPETAGRVLDEVGRAAAHDLLEPLAATIGFLRAIQDGNVGRLDPEVREFVVIALANAERTQKRMRALSVWVRLFRRPLSLARVDLAAACRRALAACARELDACAATACVGELPEVAGDERLLTELFRHLVENAIAYRSDRPVAISVAGVVEDDAVRVTFADDGLGIDPRFTDRVFGLFTRLYAYDRIPGEGVGLAIARAIVERHGGSIRAVARERGAAIEFVLPRAPEQKKPAAEGPAAGSKGDEWCGVVRGSDPPE